MGRKCWICIFLTMLLCGMSALAATDGSMRFTQETGEVNISVSGLYPNMAYSVILTREVNSPLYGAPLFLDQLTASESGTLNVSFIQMDLPACMAYLGGEFEDVTSPWYIGAVSSSEGDNIARLPDALTSIAAETFSGAAFTHVFIGDQVTAIDDHAFKDCIDLAYIFIPDNVTVFGSGVFEGCPKLTIICKTGSAAAQYAQANGIAWHER